MKSSTDTTIFFPFRILQKDICCHHNHYTSWSTVWFEVQLNGIPDCKWMVISIRWETKNRKEKRKRKLHYVTLVSVIEEILLLNWTPNHDSITLRGRAKCANSSKRDAVTQTPMDQMMWNFACEAVLWGTLDFYPNQCHMASIEAKLILASEHDWPL